MISRKPVPTFPDHAWAGFGAAGPARPRLLRQPLLQLCECSNSRALAEQQVEPKRFFHVKFLDLVSLTLDHTTSTRFQRLVRMFNDSMPSRRRWRPPGQLDAGSTITPLTM